jgi:hypothetical protein
MSSLHHRKYNQEYNQIADIVSTKNNPILSAALFYINDGFSFLSSHKQHIEQV